MGTKHLICAVLGGEYKLAQYGQWDGYPEHQGVKVLSFLREKPLEEFKAKLSLCTWATKEELDRVGKTHDWSEVYPHLSRDAGAEVLNMILESDRPLALVDTRRFAGDSLMCEWAYVIDFDKKVFEVYRGFNKDKTPADSRFPSGAEWLEKEGDYEPVELVETFYLTSLPSDERFIELVNGRISD